jgi:hypothetical protein
MLNITSLVCANANGSHLLKPITIGRSAKPRPLGHNIKNLPIIYTYNKKEWAAQELFADWVHNHFVPEVEKHEPEYVKALLLLTSAPAHPSADMRRSKNGKMKCLFLPVNTSSVI